MTASGTRVMSLFWFFCASVSLSLTWLLPNHSWPWLGFHGDAWAALMLLIVAAFVLWRNRFSIGWHGLTVLSAAMVFIPLVQCAIGMVPLFGLAWINSAYLLGFSLAILVGGAWEQESVGECADYLFLAIGIASVVSVGLQFHQFFDLESYGPWILNSTGSRHFANMAQPNLLASLLLLGLLGCGWGFYRKYLSGYGAIGIAAFLLLGLTLTESRTAWLNVILLVIVALVWRSKLPSRRYLWAVLGLAALFATLVFLLPLLNEVLRGNDTPMHYRSTSGDPRWVLWVFPKGGGATPITGFWLGPISGCAVAGARRADCNRRKLSSVA